MRYFFNTLVNNQDADMSINSVNPGQLLQQQYQTGGNENNVTTHDKKMQIHQDKMERREQLHEIHQARKSHLENKLDRASINQDRHEQRGVIFEKREAMIEHREHQQLVYTRRAEVISHTIDPVPQMPQPVIRTDE